MKDGVIMMLVSYRPLAALVLFALLERFMRSVRGGRDLFGRLDFLFVLFRSSREMPQFAGLGKRYDGPIDTVVRLPRAPDPKFTRAREPAPRAQGNECLQQ